MAPSERPVGRNSQHKARKVVSTSKTSGGCSSLGTIFLHDVCATSLVDYGSYRSCLLNKSLSRSSDGVGFQMVNFWDQICWRKGRIKVLKECYMRSLLFCVCVS